MNSTLVERITLPGETFFEPCVIHEAVSLNLSGEQDPSQTNSIIKRREEREFRMLDDRAPRFVKELYYNCNTKQTVEHVLSQKSKYGRLQMRRMSIWDAFKMIDDIVDESDGDISLPQIYHAYQTAEAMRKDGRPRWFILTGFIHDLGKMLTKYGEPQWTVVGDTFPVGCAFSKKIVFPEAFNNNPDAQNPAYQSETGIYSEGVGLDNVHMSFGHDEYMYMVAHKYLPYEASYLIRYHSFYPLHKEGAYQHLLSEKDRKMVPLLREFSSYDLYSKEDAPVDMEAIKSYYQELVAEFFPDVLDW